MMYTYKSKAQNSGLIIVLKTMEVSFQEVKKHSKSIIKILAKIFKVIQPLVTKLTSSKSLSLKKW